MSKHDTRTKSSEKHSDDSAFFSEHKEGVFYLDVTSTIILRLIACRPVYTALPLQALIFALIFFFFLVFLPAAIFFYSFLFFKSAFAYLFMVEPYFFMK